MKIFLSSNPPLKHHFTHQKEPENKTASRHATDNKTAQCALATRYGEEGEGREQNCAILTGHNVQPGGSGCPHKPQPTKKNNKKNANQPNKDASSAEFLSLKIDAKFLVLDSTSKKRPHTIT